MRPQRGAGGAGGRGRLRPPISRSTRTVRSSYTSSRPVRFHRAVAPFRASNNIFERRGARAMYASYPPPVASIIAPAIVFTETGVMQRRFRSFFSFRRALGAPVRVVLGTLMTAIGGIIGGFKLVARLLGRRSQDDMINATEAENKDLHEKLQVLRQQLVDKDQQLDGLRKANSVYVLQKVPDLRNQIKSRDELLKDITQSTSDRGTDLLVNLHNRLAAKDSTINYLRSLKSKSYEVVEDLERQLRHKQLQLIQARDQLGNTAQDIENLTRQLNERDELISVLSGNQGTESETDTLQKHMWEQSKLIESLKLGIGAPVSGDQTAVLQKQIVDQDYIITTLRRRLQYFDSGARVIDTIFFPDDRARSNLHRLTQALNRVGKSLDLCVSNIACADLSDAIIAAHQQGAIVRVITDGEQVSRLSSDLQRIASKGVPVRCDTSRAHLQHNFFIAEGEILGSGSFSWSQQAVRYNRENLILYQDPHLVKQFSSEFEELWSASQ